MRMTRNVVDVLEVLRTSNESGWWGFEIASMTGVPTPTVYGILARLEQVGWVSAHFEDIDPSEEGRPPRRLYELTSDGRESAASSIAEWKSRRAPRLQLKEHPA